MHLPKLWVPACCTPNCCRTSWGAAIHSIDQAWTEVAMVAVQSVALSGQVLIIALFRSSIFYPCYEFSCCFCTSGADSFSVSEVCRWFPSYHLIHLRVTAFSAMSLLGQTLLRVGTVVFTHTVYARISVTPTVVVQAFLQRLGCAGKHHHRNSLGCCLYIHIYVCVYIYVCGPC